MSDDENNFNYLAHVTCGQVGCVIAGGVVWLLALVGAAWLLGMT